MRSTYVKIYLLFYKNTSFYKVANTFVVMKLINEYINIRYFLFINYPRLHKYFIEFLQTYK